MSAAAPAGLGQLKQITMAVRDVGRATEFYRDTLGVPFLFAAGPTLSFFDLAGIRLMLSLPEAGIEPPGSVLYFATDDIGRTHRLLETKGVRFRTAPHKVATLADREVWLADFEDGEGNILALMSEPPIGR
jgi:methylmalonyl-CoA/ethylmalonyl-CoA epimerase